MAPSPGTPESLEKKVTPKGEQSSDPNGSLKKMVLDVVVPPKQSRPYFSEDAKRISVRCIGADLISRDERSDQIFSDVGILQHPSVLVPSAGYQLGKLAIYSKCQTEMRRQPTNVLFVSLPGFGTPEGCRHSNAVLHNVCQLVLTHLEKDDRHVMIDGALGNPAWDHESVKELLEHPRMTHEQDYFWCTSGTMINGKYFRRKSRIRSTFHTPTVAKWSDVVARRGMIIAPEEHVWIGQDVNQQKDGIPQQCLKDF